MPAQEEAELGEIVERQSDLRPRTARRGAGQSASVKPFGLDIVAQGLLDSRQAVERGAKFGAALGRSLLEDRDSAPVQVCGAVLLPALVVKGGEVGEGDGVQGTGRAGLVPDGEGLPVGLLGLGGFSVDEVEAGKLIEAGGEIGRGFGHPAALNDCPGVSCLGFRIMAGRGETVGGLNLLKAGDFSLGGRKGEAEETAREAAQKRHLSTIVQKGATGASLMRVLPYSDGGIAYWGCRLAKSRTVSAFSSTHRP